MPKLDFSPLARLARQRRLWLVLAGVAIIALAVWLIWPSRLQPAPGRSAAPAIAASSPGAASEGRDAQDATTSFWDRLWQRQQSESAAARKSAEGIPSAWPVPVPATPPAAPVGNPPGFAPPPADAAEAARRQAAKEAIRGHLADLLTLTDEQARAGRLTDTTRLMKVIERLEADMRTAGMPPVIDVGRMRQTLATAEKMQRLGDELAREAAKGKAADTQRLERLNRQMVELQPALVQSPVDTRALVESLRAR